MDRNHDGVARRDLLVAGALGAAAIGFAAPAVAAAAGHTAAEAANVKLVTEFCNSFGEPEKLKDFLAPDSSVRFDEKQAPMIGPAALVDAWKKAVGDGKVSAKILSTVAKGPIVMNVRVDTVTTAGKPDQIFKIVGVFLVRDGKIKEWTDYQNG